MKLNSELSFKRIPVSGSMRSLSLVKASGYNKNKNSETYKSKDSRNNKNSYNDDNNKASDDKA